MQKPQHITIIGAGNGGIAAAADLTIRGFQVTLCETSSRWRNLEAISDMGGIHLETLASTHLNEGFAKLHKITSDIEEALRETEVIFVIVSAFRQEEIAKLCAPFLHEQHKVVLAPGNFGGSIHFTNVLREAGCSQRISIGETECMMYACRKKDPTTIWIRGYKHNLGFAAFPASNTERMLATLQQVYPTYIPRSHVLETGLSNPNTFVHAPLMLFNLSNIENSTDILMYHQAFTESIGTIVARIEEERMTFNSRLPGLNLRPMPEIVKGYYAYQGAKGETLCALHRSNPIFSWTYLPKTLDHRYFREDVPYGLVPLYGFAEHISVPTPTLKAVIDLCCVVTGVNFYEQGRDLEQLRLAEYQAEDLLKYVLSEK